jgi:alanine dehydrogenase
VGRWGCGLPLAFVHRAGLVHNAVMARCLVLREATVAECLKSVDVEEITRGALRDYSAGTVVHSLRTAQFNDIRSGLLGLMPAYDSSRRIYSTKLVTVFHQNGASGLPTHQALIALHSADNGELLAIMDGRLITELRTAAASAVASRALAGTGPHVVAIVGTGVQARAHARALNTTLRPVRTLIWGRSEDSARRLARELTQAGLEGVAVATTADSAVQQATVAATVTASSEPVLGAGAAHAGLHVNAVGVCTAKQRELPAELVGRARVFVDSREAALREAGDLLLAFGDRTGERIAAEVGEVLLGRHPGRQSEDEITLFKSVGIAAEDLALARMVYERARKKGLGEEIEI